MQAKRKTVQPQTKVKAAAKKNLGGRPVKLTQKIQDTIVTAIRVGNYLETAAAMAGIRKETFYDWLYKGANSKEENEYKKFSDAVYEALAASEGMAVAAITKVGEPHDVVKTRTIRKPLIENGQPVLDENGRPVFVTETVTETTRETEWRALAWRLERRFSKRWGRREYLETAITEKPIEEMSDAEIDAELNEILEKAEAK
jgi:hypothetical protein